MKDKRPGAPPEALIVALALDLGRVTLSEASAYAGVTRSWAWKLARRLASEGVLRLEKRGGVVVLEPGSYSYRALLRVGILRASEYPYIPALARLLESLTRRVEIIVYDEAYRLASDLASGRLHLGMAPAVTLLAVHRLSAGSVLIAGGGSRGGTGVVDAGSGDGHATTMASTMELCAEHLGLPEPRVYAASGDEILRLVSRRAVRYGVVWEPYLYIAKTAGMRTEPCDLPFCCLLGAHRVMEPELDKVARLFADAVGEARRRLRDPVYLEAYARLVGLEPGLVKATVASYEFLEEPPVGDLERLLPLMGRVVLPPDTVRRAVYR